MKDKNDKEVKTQSFLSDISKGVELKSSKDRKLRDRELTAAERAAQQIEERRRKIQEANFGTDDEDIDSDAESDFSDFSYDSSEGSVTASSGTSAGFDSDDELSPSAKSTSTGEQSGTSLFSSKSEMDQFLKKATSGRQTKVETEPDDDWEAETSKSPRDKLAEAKEALAKSYKDPKLAAEKYAGLQSHRKTAKDDLAAKFGKQSSAAKATPTLTPASPDSSVTRKADMQAAKSALEEKFNKTKRAVSQQDIERDLGAHKSRMQSAKSALEEKFNKTKRAVSQQDIERDLGTHKSRMQSAKSALEDALPKMRRGSVEDTAKVEDKSKKDLEAQEQFKVKRQAAIKDAAARGKQHDIAARAKLSKAEAMNAIKSIADLGVRTKQAHAATEAAIKIAQSISITIKSKDHTEKELRRLENETQDYIRKLEANASELRNFINNAPKSQDKKWNEAIAVSVEVLKEADKAIVLAKAEIKLINAAIARDLAVESAKNAIALAQRKSDMARIAHEAAAAARKKIGAKETLQAQEKAKREAEAQDTARLVAEAEAQRAAEEARIREEEAARLVEQQRIAEQQAAAAQQQAAAAAQNVSRMFYGR